MTQQLIDDSRLTPENEMLNDVKTLLADRGGVSWRGCYGESLVRILSSISYISRIIAIFLLKFPNVHCCGNKRRSGVNFSDTWFTFLDLSLV